MRGRNAVNAGPEPDAGLKPDAGPKPDAINAGPEPDAGLKPDTGPKPDAINAGPEPDAGLKPDMGPKPDAINAGPEPDAGVEAQCSKCRAGARCRAEARCGAEAQCNKCGVDRKVQEMRKQMSMLRNSARRCNAVTLICLWSCFVEQGWGLSVEIPRSWMDGRRSLSHLWSITIQAVFLCRISYNGKRKQ
ncbi:hypothetical protein CDL15_Pgr001012 [Punica granatum]|uniref:Uncharacterized protein n=1 Tax=Punica granatum TaxID=22663 RepID=A0A218WG52_PUNGR|nr:hypothetical protein CDL15_Pgr001012 [Punica granatum]